MTTMLCVESFGAITVQEVPSALNSAFVTVHSTFLKSLPSYTTL
nr:MAG TPA: hypothetical protein [Caudoviricetes sp.]